MSFPNDIPPQYPPEAWRRALEQFERKHPNNRWSGIPLTIQCAYVAEIAAQITAEKVATR